MNKLGPFTKACEKGDEAEQKKDREDQTSDANGFPSYLIDYYVHLVIALTTLKGTDKGQAGATKLAVLEAVQYGIDSRVDCRHDSLSLLNGLALTDLAAADVGVDGVVAHDGGRQQ